MRPDADTARGPTRGPGPDGFPGEVPPRSEKDGRLLFSNPASTPKGRQPFPAPQSQNHAPRTRLDLHRKQRQTEACGKDTDAPGQASLGTWR